MTHSHHDRTRAALEWLYKKYNRREFVHPDPLEFLYNYTDPADIEIVALIASSLAYGRVAQILNSVSAILDKMQSPHEFLKGSNLRSLKKTFREFKHRFTTGEEIASMLYGIAGIIGRHGSIEKCYMIGLESGGSTIEALSHLVGAIKSEAGCPCDSLLPDPSRGSACKRLNLFMRWMVRRDEVDPGIWYNVQPSSLIVPLDVHMHRIGLRLGLTSRKQADQRTAVEITESFREFSPEDPVKYDFALTRLGIRGDIDPGDFYKKCRVD